MTRSSTANGFLKHRVDDRSDDVLRIVGYLSAELGRGPTSSEIARYLSDGKGDVRAELGILLGRGAVACVGLTGTGLAAGWIPVPR